MSDLIESRAELMAAAHGYPGRDVCEALVAVTLTHWPVDAKRQWQSRRAIRQRDKAIAELRWQVGMGGWGSDLLRPWPVGPAHHLWERATALLTSDSNGGVHERQISPGAIRCWAVISLAAEAVRTALTRPWDSADTAEHETRAMLDNELINLTRSALQLADKCNEHADANKAPTDSMRSEWRNLLDKHAALTAHAKASAGPETHKTPA